MRPNQPPEGFTDLSTLPNTVLRMGYGTDHNFTGAPIPGYGAPAAWLLAPVAEALCHVASALEARRLGLVVLDAYRPWRANRAMVAWTEGSDNGWLIEQGYLARESHHCRGTAVDVTARDLASRDGELLDMGTRWDTFTEASHRGGVEGPAHHNRELLRELMERRGFIPYSKEWWHYRLPLAEGPLPPVRDVPYGAHESGEDLRGAPR